MSDQIKLIPTKYGYFLKLTNREGGDSFIKAKNINYIEEDKIMNYTVLSIKGGVVDVKEKAKDIIEAIKWANKFY